jgi:hypothetical protein
MELHYRVDKYTYTQILDLAANEWGDKLIILQY